MTFNTQPSPEYARLTAELNELKKQECNPALSLEEHCAIIHRIVQVNAALRETPEQQFLDEVRADEMATYEQETAAELERRGRMVSVLSLNPDGCRDIDEAITEHSFSDTAQSDGLLPFGPGTGEPFSVVADMGRMSPAQVTKCLRAMADRIEEQGLLVYRGPVPQWWNRNANFGDSEWYADERVDGTFRHNRYLKGQ